MLRADDFLRDVGAWLKAGKIKYREDIVEGLENAPEAFIGAPARQEFRQVARQGRRSEQRHLNCITGDRAPVLRKPVGVS